MKILQNTTTWIGAALILLMAATRYNHFGSSLALPDASYAVFFLGGLVALAASMASLSLCRPLLALP